MFVSLCHPRSPSWRAFLSPTCSISSLGLVCFRCVRSNVVPDFAPQPTMASPTRHILITAGPTHEPIDAVRFLGNRSSGRTGIAIADEAAQRDWAVRLLLGQTPGTPSDSRVTVDRFRTTADLEQLLAVHFGGCDVLVMAAAVADFRPEVSGEGLAGKVRRGDGAMTLRLVPTPDLLRDCAHRRKPGQYLVGFALESASDLEASAEAKLVGKGVDLIVANPLETMDARTIGATVYERTAEGPRVSARTDGLISKDAFGGWLMDLIESRLPA
jgi:phosphopantothenoylcysteine decarboxylase / phosphopantothenate---cysteine ligase